LALAAAILLALPAAMAEDPVGWLSLGGSGGISGYALGDVNRRIEGAGNAFTAERGWTPLSPIRFGWTFFADAKVPVPYLRSVFLTAGYGVSSGSTSGPDSNELLEVGVKQKALHARLLYALPWRFHKDVRLFVGGGLLSVREQRVEASHTHRNIAGGTGQYVETERLERVRYQGSGVGALFGAAAEYMVQDRITLCVDVGYRIADISYKDWSATDDVTITETGDPTVYEGDQSTSEDRLSLLNSYVGHAFLDWDATRDAARGMDRLFEPLNGAPVAGPKKIHLQPVDGADLGIDLTGFQLQLGLRIYLF
jgi:hypothetical protein